MVYENIHLKTLYHSKPQNHAVIEYLEHTPYLTLNITKGCNLGCPYCVSGKSPNSMFLPTIIDELGLDLYLTKVEQIIGDRYPFRIRLTGEGEVSLSKYFAPVVDWALRKNYEIIIQSNLHGINNLEKVVKKYPDKAHLIMIGVSFHAGAYMLLYDFGQAIAWRNFWVYNWFPRLIDLGVRITKIDTPLHPILFNDDRLEEEFDHLMYLKSVAYKEMDEAKIKMNESGDYFIQPVSLVGQGYPEKYTQAENQWVSKLQNKYKGISAQYDTSWTEAQIPYMTHHAEMKGALCWKPMRGIDIKADGTILLCHSWPQDKLPNLREWNGIPSLYTENPIPCPYVWCRCRAHAIFNSMAPHNVSLQEYYHAYYTNKGEKHIAQLFKKVEET